MEIRLDDREFRIVKRLEQARANELMSVLFSEGEADTGSFRSWLRDEGLITDETAQTMLSQLELLELQTRDQQKRTSRLSDAQVVDALNQKDSEGLEEIYRRYYSQLVEFARHLFPDLSTSEDNVQNAYIKFWNNQKLKISSLYHFLSWMHSTIRNLKERDYRDHIKRKKIEGLAQELTYPELESIDSDDHPISQLLLEAILDREISQLPEPQRTILLQRLDGIPVGEIAVQLNLPTASVSIQLTRARERLKKKLDEHLRKRG